MLIKLPEPELLIGCYPPEEDYEADIIILSMYRFPDTVKAIESALSQKNARIHVTVLVQKPSLEHKLCFAQLFKEHANLGLFTLDQNLGVGGGRNYLSSIGHGEIIIGLDNDAIFADDLTVFRALESFRMNANLGVLGFKILSEEGTKLDDYSWGYPSLLKTHCNGRFKTTTFVGAGHAIRRITWNQSGGYDPKLFFTWEEYDFCLRAISHNWLIEYSGECSVYHKVSDEARVAWSVDRMRFYVRNRLIIARKWGAAWFMLLPRMFGYLFKGLLNHRLKAAIAGILEAIQEDRHLEKKPMTSYMRKYIMEHESQYRGSVYQRLRYEVFGAFF